METGKLPPNVLEGLLSDLGAADPRVLVGPGVGEDCAVVDMGDRVLIAKSDPITFAAENVGRYVVQVNANDVACTGGVPRWFMPTVLLPSSCATDDLRKIFADISEACRQIGVAIIGGHTEITEGLPRPIVAGTMLGELEDRSRLVSTSGALDGDSIIVTTGVAIEGAAILAREHGNELRALGLDAVTLQNAASYLDNPGISVLPAARALFETNAVHSMHDVTEGGLITALREVAAASNLGLVAEGESVPLLPECAAICEVLGLDPLGLLGSGALVATMASGDVPAALRALDRVGVSGWEIGQMMEPSDGLWLIDRNGERTLPEFRRDELARYLEEQRHSPK